MDTRKVISGIPEDVHKVLLHAALDSGRPVYDIGAEALRDWLVKNYPQGLENLNDDRAAA